MDYVQLYLCEPSNGLGQRSKITAHISTLGSLEWMVVQSPKFTPVQRSSGLLEWMGVQIYLCTMNFWTAGMDSPSNLCLYNVILNVQIMPFEPKSLHIIQY